MTSSSSKRKGTIAKRQKSVKNHYASQKDELEPEYFSNPNTATSLGLPAELLQTILRDAFRDASEPSEYNWGSIRIPCHVCRYWRRLVLHDSTFWTRIFIPELSPAAVDSFIRRSGSKPLEVHIHLTDVSYTSKAVKTAVKAVFGETDRFRTLWLDVEMKNLSARMTMEAYLRQYLRSSDFTLEDLRVSMLVRDGLFSRGRKYLEIPCSLFGPKLRNVFLHDIAAVDATPFLTNLTKLTLSRVHHFSTLNEVLDILQACPKLLYFEFNHPLRIGCHIVRKDEFVGLPALRMLYLHLPFPVLNNLLRRIQIPTDITWGFQCCVGYDTWQTIFSSETLQSFLSLHSQATSSVVLYTSSRCCLALEFFREEDNSGDPCFFQVQGGFSIPAEEILDRMNSFQHFLGFSEVRKLSVRFEHHAPERISGYFTTLASLFPNVCHLSLIHFRSNRILSHLLETLKTTNTANLPIDLLFSKLRRLEILGQSGPILISNDSFAPELLSCLDAREKAGAPIHIVSLAEDNNVSSDPDAVSQLGDRVTWVALTGEDEKIFANIFKRLELFLPVVF